MTYRKRKVLTTDILALSIIERKKRDHILGRASLCSCAVSLCIHRLASNFALKFFYSRVACNLWRHLRVFSFRIGRRADHSKTFMTRILYIKPPLHRHPQALTLESRLVITSAKTFHLSGGFDNSKLELELGWTFELGPWFHRVTSRWEVLVGATMGHDFHDFSTPRAFPCYFRWPILLRPLIGATF